MGKKWTIEDLPSLNSKRAVVTGASSGLGLECATALAAAGASVVLACRDAGKGARALDTLRRRAPEAQAEVMALDLAELASVQRFAEAFSAKYGALDILLNNAGVMALPLRNTKDGFEMQIGTNHLGHFALTGRLLEALAAAPAARVINVASLAHRWTRGLDLSDLNFERGGYNKWDAYGKSKLANLLFTFELDRRLRRAGTPILAVAAHPGYSATNLGFVGPAMEDSALGRIGIAIGNRLFAQSAAMGALPLLYAAAAADVAGGDYIGPGGLRQMRGYPEKVGCKRSARDPDTAAQLWTISEQLTHLRYLS